MYFARLAAYALPPGGTERVSVSPEALVALANAAGVASTVLLTAPNGAAVYAGLGEATAEEGTVGLPAGLARALSLESALAPENGGASGARERAVVLSVRQVVLPAARAIALRPLSGPAFFDELPDPSAALALALTSAVAVSPGTILSLPPPDGGEPELVAVVSVEPAGAPAVLCVDVNVAVSFDEDPSAPPAPAPLVVDGPPVELALPPAGSPAFARARALLPAALGGAVLVVDGATPAGSAGVDVFASLRAGRAPPPDGVRHTWALRAGAAAPGAAAASVGLDADGAAWPDAARVLMGATEAAERQGERTLPVRLAARAAAAGGDASGAPAATAVRLRLVSRVGGGGGAGGGGGGARGAGADAAVPAPLDGATASLRGAPLPPAPPPPPPPGACPNCGAAVPASAAAMHAVSCARANARCAEPRCGAVLRRGPGGALPHAHCPEPGCGAALPPRALPAHARAFHSERFACPYMCGAPPAPLADAHEHATAACPQRPAPCRFCGASIPAGGGGRARDGVDRARGLTEHESACGSRTRTCTLCSPPRGVLRKGWDDHIALQHAAELAAHDADAAAPASDADVDGGGASGGGGGGGWRVRGGPGVSLAARAWACGACTLAGQALARSGCEACGAPRPPLLARAGAGEGGDAEFEPWRRAARRRPAGGGGSRGGGGEMNVDGDEGGAADDDELGAADSPRRGGSAGGGGRGRASAGGAAGAAGGGADLAWGGARRAPSPPPAPAGPCANGACGRRADAPELPGAGGGGGGFPASFGACGRCASLLLREVAEALSGGGEESPASPASPASPGGDDAPLRGAIAAALAELRARYARQALVGCGAAACTNPACATAAGAPGAAARWGGARGGVPPRGALDEARARAVADALAAQAAEGLERALRRAAAGGRAAGALSSSGPPPAPWLHACVSVDRALEPAALALPADLLAPSPAAAAPAAAAAGGAGAGARGTTGAAAAAGAGKTAVGAGKAAASRIARATFG